MLYTFEIIENEAHFHRHKHIHILYRHANDLSPYCHTHTHNLIHSHALCLLVCTLGYRSGPQILIRYRISRAYLLCSSLSLSHFFLLVNHQNVHGVYDRDGAEAEKALKCGHGCRVQCSMLTIFTT